VENFKEAFLSFSKFGSFLQAEKIRKTNEKASKQRNNL
jgi:hypothetical protein